jgi:hypothetical protein
VEDVRHREEDSDYYNPQQSKPLKAFKIRNRDKENEELLKVVIKKVAVV